MKHTIIITAFCLLYLVGSGALSPLIAKENYEGSKIALIKFEGLKYTSPDVVRRELHHREDMTYSPARWEEEKNRLESLDIFAAVTLEASKKEDGLTLTYRFSELPPLIPFISMKITDQNGFIAGPALAFLNLFGEGIRLEFYARATMLPDFFQARELLSVLSSRWAGPLPLEYDIWFIFNDLYNPLKNFNEQSITAEADFFYRFNNRFKVLFTTGLFTVWQDEGNQTFTSGDFSAPMFIGSDSTDIVPKLGAGAVFDSRNRRLNPNYGLYSEFRLTGFGKVMGGEGNYLEVLADLRGYYTFFERHIFHIATLGQYRPGTMGANQYYHVGGPNTLRGYEPDHDLFGQHEFLGTFEYRFEVIKKTPFSLFGFHLYSGLQVVLGADLALLWNKEDTPGDPMVLAGYFTGLHILFPGFDRLRLEFGIRKGDVTEKRVAFAFSVGLYEKAIVQRWRIR